MNSLGTRDAEAVIRAIESAAMVKRGYQFFVWTQTHLRALIPHEFVVCGAYQRTRRDLVLEAFNSVSLPSDLLGALTDPSSVLMRQIVGGWLEKRGRPARLKPADFDGTAIGRERDLMLELGFEQMLVHGVTRPQRPSEIESLFILSNRGEVPSEAQLAVFDLLLPQLHTTYLRVQATEREVMGALPVAAANKRLSGTALVTARERQILMWVREGMSNQEIGEQLAISPLTVKNHIQKILRKLGASNRAHAVAKAMTMNLLGVRSDDKGSKDL